jgi:low temperature requirement protein LtrA
MTEPGPATTARRWVLPLTAREPHESGRAATSLELFFDLVFVVAVAQASASLHHSLAEDHLAEGVVGFVVIFFAIWWAWMNFTWFASAYDNDDVPYRLATFVQMAGVLILAAGIPRAFQDQDFGIVVLGYVVMRVALASQWLRASFSDPDRAECCRRYALGVTLVQICWVGMLFLPDALVLPVWALLALSELAVPIWAERKEPTTWHPGHITERYGLFTIIVLGELVLSGFLAVQVALDGGAAVLDLVKAGAGAGLLVFSMWWLYFSQPAEDLMEHAREVFEARTGYDTFIWGYGHYFVLGAIAAVGAGIAVVVDQQTHHAEVSNRFAVLSVAIPLTVYLLSVWAVHHRANDQAPVRTAAYFIAALLVLVLGALGTPVWTLGLVTAALVVQVVVAAEREGAAIDLG